MGARGVSHIVIDEVHEWSIILELILKRLWAILKRNTGSSFRVVLMSATLDAEALQRYFSDVDAHVVEVKGSSYPTKWCWLADWPTNVLQRLQEPLSKQELDQLPRGAEKLPCSQALGMVSQQTFDT